MEIKDVIRKRRSIRKYKDKVPPDADIKKILSAAIWAPSGLNNQPWKFKVLKGGEKDGIASFTDSEDVIKDAPIAICIFLDKKASYNRDKDILAIGACIQNMLLQAFELGLATCWLGEILNQRKEVEKHLNISAQYELLAVVTLGCPDEKEESKRKDLEKFIIK